MYTLVVIRHGESEWNQKNLFCGWTDVDLVENGFAEARKAGELLKEGGYTFDVCYTSVLKRAIHTAYTVLDTLDLAWIPVIKDYHLNERHYGALQGLNKSAADMVLLDDKFTTIVHAIREGRRVYRNIRKVIQFLLTGNIAEIAALTLATALNLPAPLLAVHILWVNLATATLPALALGVDPEEKDAMKRPPVRSGSLFDRSLIRSVAAGGLFTALLTTLAYWIGADSSHAAGQTMAFAVLAFSQILRPFSLRSREPFWRRASAPNGWLRLAALLSAAFMAAILLLPQARAAFDVTALTPAQWGVAAALALASAAFAELWKRFPGSAA